MGNHSRIRVPPPRPVSRGRLEDPTDPNPLGWDPNKEAMFAQLLGQGLSSQQPANWGQALGSGIQSFFGARGVKKQGEAWDRMERIKGQRESREASEAEREEQAQQAARARGAVAILRATSTGNLESIFEDEDAMALLSNPSESNTLNRVLGNLQQSEEDTFQSPFAYDVGGQEYFPQSLEEVKMLEDAEFQAIGAPAGGEKNSPPAGYRWTPNGDLEKIPGGPAFGNAESRDNPINPYAMKSPEGEIVYATSRQQQGDLIGQGYAPYSKPTTGERSAARLVTRLNRGFNTLMTPDGRGGMPWESLTGGWNRATQALLPRRAESIAHGPTFETAKLVMEDIGDAILRTESGAAIGKEEIDRRMNLLSPQWGEEKETLAEKATQLQAFIQEHIPAAGDALGELQWATPYAPPEGTGPARIWDAFGPQDASGGEGGDIQQASTELGELFATDPDAVNAMIDAMDPELAAQLLMAGDSMPGR